MTSQAPEPPDPEALLARARERAREAQERIEQDLYAAHQHWESYGDPAIEDVLGTTEHFGDATPEAGEKIFGGLLKNGPYEAMPYDDLGTVEEFYQNRAGDFLRDIGARNLNEAAAATGWDPLRGGISYDIEEMRNAVNADPERFGLPSSAVTRQPAPITYSPTSSINPPRPRTVAAGYDGIRRVLTVVFRDGTLYNYYGVGKNEWNNFVKAHSKGRFIKRHLDAKVRGYADMVGVPQVHRDLLYKAARTSQVKQKGYTGKQTRAGRQTAERRYARENPGARRYKIPK